MGQVGAYHHHHRVLINGMIRRVNELHNTWPRHPHARC